MVFNFVGEVDSVSERQKDFISEVLEKKGFKNCDVSIELLGKAGDNFMAKVKRIVVNQNGKTFKMIAKLAPIVREIRNLTILFRNEHVMYTEVFPKFKELQKIAGVPEKDWFKHAECYGTFMETPNEVILLEDLKESNFSILHNPELMTIECVQLVMKNFAVLHSLSYVLKNQTPEKYNELKSKLADEGTLQSNNSLDNKERIIIQFRNEMEANALESLSDERYKNVFRGTMSKYHELNTKLTENVTDSPYSVIQQGDGWTNNIMFAFENNRPSKCVLIDYQMSKESNPMYDVMQMLFNSIDTNLRIEHYTEFVDYYYSELDKSLNNYGLKAKDIYPRGQLDVDMKKYIKIVLAITLLIANLVVKDVDEASKLQNTLKSDKIDNAVNVVIEKSSDARVLFKNKLEGLAQSVIALGLLEEKNST